MALAAFKGIAPAVIPKTLKQWNSKLIKFLVQGAGPGEFEDDLNPEQEEK